MTIKLDDVLKKKVITLCVDGLNENINEREYIEDFHDEILTQIELLFLLGETEEARGYAYEYGNKVIGSLNQIKFQREIHEILNKYPTA